MKNKALTITICVLIVVAIALAVYFLVIKKKKETEDTAPGSIELSKDGNPDNVRPIGGYTHIVSTGENLTSIAKKYDSSVDAIVAANKSTYPSITRDYIQADWLLQIP